MDTGSAQRACLWREVMRGHPGPPLQESSQLLRPRPRKAPDHTDGLHSRCPHWALGGRCPVLTH